MQRARQLVHLVSEKGQFYITVEGVLSDGMPEWCMDSVDVLYPVEVGAAYYDEEEFDAFFPGVAEDALGEIDDDAWQLVDNDEEY